MRVESWGLVDAGPSVTAANSVVVVLPNMRAPAALRVIIGAASMVLGPESAYMAEFSPVGISKARC